MFVVVKSPPLAQALARLDIWASVQLRTPVRCNQ